jgi:hypothetical protein
MHARWKYRLGVIATLAIVTFLCGQPRYQPELKTINERLKAEVSRGGRFQPPVELRTPREVWKQ